MSLDLAPLRRVAERLREGLLRWQQNPADEQIRDGLIQRFEFTYELGSRMLKRYLEQTAAVPDEFGRVTFQDLIRTGNQRDVLRSDWPAWRRFRDMRARSSHTCDAGVALSVVAVIPDFLLEAAHLCAEPQRRLA